MLYALLDKSTVIGAQHLLAALACWQRVEESVRHVFGEQVGDDVADKILAALRSLPDGMTRTQIRDYLQRNMPPLPR